MLKPILIFFAALLIAMSIQGQDSLYLSTDKPGTNEVDSPVEVGLVIRPSLDGFVSWFKYYKTTANDTATAKISLWDFAGNLLFSTFYSAPGKTGWQRVRINSTIILKANSNYVVSMFTPSGRYGQRVNVFTVAKTKGIITAPASPSVSGNGRYKYGGGFPTGTYSSASYMLDVVFEQDVPHATLIVNAGRDTLLKYPTDSFRLQGIVTGDQVVYSWKNPDDPNWSSNSLQPVIKPLTLQHYTFQLTGTDRWGNSMTSEVNLDVVRPIMLILSDGTWIMLGGNLLVDPQPVTQ